jgi:hemoglobin
VPPPLEPVPDAAQLKSNVRKTLDTTTGGPCVYTGRDMKTAHAGAGITKADGDRSLKIFGEVLNKFKVPEKEQQELAALLLPLEKDVVDKQ